MAELKTPVSSGQVQRPKPDEGKTNPDNGNTLPDGVTKNEDGTFVNADGKAVNEKGEVVNTKPDDTQPSKPDETKDDESVILVDDKEYKLDDKGNALDSDGNVFKTKEELDALESDDEPDGKGDGEGGDTDEEVTIKDIQKLSGIELPDEDDEKSYDLTLENLAKRETKIKETVEKEAKQSAISEFFSSNPDLYKAYMYKSQKGSLDGFQNQPYYKSIEIDENNEEQLTNLIIDAEVKKGNTPERAKRYANYIKDNNELVDEGKAAHEFLVNTEDKQFESFEQSKKQEVQKQIEQEKNFYGTYYENGKEVVVNKEGTVYDKIVNKGQFGNYVIPESGVKVDTKDGQKKLTRKDIYNYISKPVNDNGATQAMLDTENYLKDMDNLLYTYLNNLTGNMSVFLERQALENKGKQIKGRLRTNKGATPKPSSSSKSIKLKTPVNK